MAEKICPRCGDKIDVIETVFDVATVTARLFGQCCGHRYAWVDPPPVGELKKIAEGRERYRFEIAQAEARLARTKKNAAFALRAYFAFMGLLAGIAIGLLALAAGGFG